MSAFTGDEYWKVPGFSCRTWELQKSMVNRPRQKCVLTMMSPVFRSEERNVTQMKRFVCHRQGRTFMLLLLRPKTAGRAKVLGIRLAILSWQTCFPSGHLVEHAISRCCSASWDTFGFVCYFFDVSSLCRAGMFDLGEAYPEHTPENATSLLFTLCEAYPGSIPHSQTSRPGNVKKNKPIWTHSREFVGFSASWGNLFLVSLTTCRCLRGL